MAQNEADRLAQRKAVDQYMLEAQRKRTAARAAKQKPPTAQQLAMQRNAELLRKQSPAGWLALLQALGFGGK